MREKIITSIFPLGFSGNNTEIATNEDNERMKAWGEALNNQPSQHQTPYGPIGYGNRNIRRTWWQRLIAWW